MLKIMRDVIMINNNYFYLLFYNGHCWTIKRCDKFM